MLDLKLLLEFVMNVIMDLFKGDVLFVEDLESLMHIIAKNARRRRKIEMDVQR